jgi:ABC-type sugar transport system substrate-binding protein
MRRFTWIGLVAVLAALTIGALGACGDDDDDGGSSGGGGGGEQSAGGTFTEAEVEEASKPWNCGQVHPVPKDPPDTKLGFINPGQGDPFVAAWSAGMKDAAEFYGVEYKEALLPKLYDFSKIPETYRTLSAFQPDVVGALADESTGKALLTAAEADGSEVLFLDTKVEGAKDMGLLNDEAGRLEGAELNKAVEPLLENEWKGKKIVVVGITSQGCVPCDERVDAAFEELKKVLPEGANVKYQKLANPAWTTEAVQQRMIDVITANPDSAFVAAPLDDATATGVFNAFRREGVEDLGRVASIGGDNLAVANIAKGSPSWVAAIDVKPYCEGWNWIEAALAVGAGEEFEPFPITGVITPENIDEYKWRLEETFE